MYCVNGIGSGIGPILARRWTGDRDKPLRVSISFGYVIAAIGIADYGTCLQLWERCCWVGLSEALAAELHGYFQRNCCCNAPRTKSADVSSALSSRFLHSWGVRVRSSLARSWIGFNCQVILWGMGVLTLIPAVLWWFWQIRYNRLKRE